MILITFSLTFLIYPAWFPAGHHERLRDGQRTRDAAATRLKGTAAALATTLAPELLLSTTGLF